MWIIVVVVNNGSVIVVWPQSFRDVSSIEQQLNRNQTYLICLWYMYSLVIIIPWIDCICFLFWMTPLSRVGGCSRRQTPASCPATGYLSIKIPPEVLVVDTKSLHPAKKPFSLSFMGAFRLYYLWPVLLSLLLFTFIFTGMTNNLMWTDWFHFEEQLIYRDHLQQWPQTRAGHLVPGCRE